ncbi:hornerin [Biomphalaria pfeifferi]|uniref:Hornerin n=1 Tax=Biomphalaria pfeifferi TaxID=112525 RepID=A0AAD8FB87_BIOPF|nr:hornerin [Biomphalaria pfeifferi]
MVAALSRTSPLHGKQKPRDNPTRLSRDVLLGLSVFFVDESSAMTPYTHLLLLFLIYLLALPASVLSSPIGCDWLKIPDPNPGQPLFNDSEYKTTLAPDVPVGSPVLTVYANDTDVNDTMYYSLEDCDYTDWITVDTESGLIKVIRSLMDIYAIEIECTVLVQDRENLTDSTVKTDRSGLFIKLYDIREIVDDEDQFDSREVEWTTGEEMATSPTVTTSSNIKIQTSKPTEGSSTSAKSTLATTTKPIVATTSKPTLVNITTKPTLANTTTKSILVNITTKPTMTNTTTKPASATTIKPIGANTTKPTVATTTKPTVATTTKPTVVTTTKSTLATTTKPTVATTTKSTVATTTKPAIAYTTKSTLATTTKPIVVTNITKTTLATNKTTTATVSNNKTQTSKPTNTSASTSAAYNKTQPFKSSTISTTVAYNKTTTAKLKPGKTTATAKPKVTAKQTTKNPTGKVIQPSGAAKKNKTRLVKKVKKPGKEGGAPVEYEYDYEYEYDDADKGENVNGEIEASVGKGGKTRGVQKKKKTKTRGQGGYTESYERSYSYNDTSVEETESEEVGSYDLGGKRRQNGRKKEIKKRKHGGSKDYDDYDYDYDYSSGNRSRSFGGGHKKKGQRWRRRHGENNTSSEEIGSWDASYSHNRTRNDTKGSYDSGSKESSYKHRKGIKYKGRRRHHKHGENSTSSEELSYYSYSYNGSRNNSSEVYSKGSSEKAYKRMGGYKHNGGKRKHRLGENSTSSEEAESGSATYSYSYNGTRNETSGSDESYSKERSYKHRGGHRYKGRKKSHRNGENSTSSEEAEFGSAIYSYSYKGTRNETSGSYESYSKERSYKHRGGHRYKGRKKSHRNGENSTSSEEAEFGSAIYSYSYKGTRNETSGSDESYSKERSYKHRGGHRYKGRKKSHRNGENSTSSEEAESGSAIYSYSYNGTRNETSGSYESYSKERSYKHRGGHRYKGRKKSHRIGENSASSGEAESGSAIYSYSYNGTRNETSGSYEYHSKERSYKHRGGHRYKGRKKSHRNGENSTSLEEDESRSAIYSYSYNGTRNETSGSHEPNSKERSYKHRGGHRYKGRKKSHRNGENSTSSEEDESRSAIYSYSYNGTRNEISGSHESNSKERSYKHRGVHRYKGRKRAHRFGKNSTSEELASSSGYYSFDYNRTSNDTSNSYRKGSEERSHKVRGGPKYKKGKVRHGHGENSTSSELADSNVVSYEYSFTEIADRGEETSPKYKGGLTKFKTVKSVKKSGKKRKGHASGESELSEHNSRNKSSFGNEKKSRGGSKHKDGRGRHTYGENSTSSEYVDYETDYYDGTTNGTSNSTESYSGEERSSKIKDGREQVKHVKRGKGIKSQNSASQEDYDVDFYDYSVSKNNSAGHTEKSYKNGSGVKGGKHRRVHGHNSTSGEYFGSRNGIDNSTSNLTSGSHMGSGKERSYKDKSDTNRGHYKAREKKRGKERKEIEAGNESSESVNAGSRNESLSGNQREKNTIGRKQRGNSTEENDSENFSYEYSFTESGNSTSGSFAGSGEEKSYNGETGKRKTPTKISGKRKWRKGEGFTGSKFSETTDREDRWEVGSRNESLSDSQTYSKNRNGFKRKRGKTFREQGANSTSIEDDGSAASYFSSNWTGSDINDSDRGGISNSSHKHRGEKQYRSGNRNGLGRNSSAIEERGSESYNGTKGSWELSKTRQSDRQQERNKNKIKMNGKRRKSPSSFDQEEGFSAEDFGSWNRSESSRKHISKSKSNFRIQGRKKKYRKGENFTSLEETGSGSGYYSYNGTRNSTSSENASAEEDSFSLKGVRRKGNRGYKGRKRGYRKGAESGDNSTSLMWESREDNYDYSLNEGSTSVNGSHGEVDSSSNIGNKLRRKSQYRVSGKHRNAKSNKGEKEGLISKGNVFSNEKSYVGSINNSTNSESESRSGIGGKRGKKYRSEKRKISGKYRTGKSNRGEKEGNYSNSYFDYEDFEYNSTASNETEDIELRNRSSTGQGQKYRIGKHRIGGKHRKGNVTEGEAEGGNEEGARYDYYYYYDYYDDTNETESSYDLGEEYEMEASDGTPEQLSGNVAANDRQAESGAGSSGSGGSDTVSSNGESSHWREEWTEAPTYGEYEYWQKEYEYEVTDQPTP